MEEDCKDVERRRKRWEEDAEGRVMNGERRFAVIGEAAEQRCKVFGLGRVVADRDPLQSMQEINA